MTLSVGWFTAGRGPGSRAMFERALAAIDAGELDARIEFVFMHRERGEGEGSDAFLDRAQERGIPVVAVSSRRFREERGGTFASVREAYDERTLDALRGREAELCVLAGHLLILGAEMVRRFPFINLHPSLPGGPVGLWQQVIWQLIDARAEETGAMVFRVTEELDGGPPLTFARAGLRGPRFDALWAEAADKSAASLRERYGESLPLFAAIREAEVALEAPLVADTLRLLASGALVLPSPPDAPAPVDLTPPPPR